MNIKFCKTGQEEDLSNFKMNCIPSKPKYAEVDLCFNLEGGAPICLADVSTNYLDFNNREILGKEIANRWNIYKELSDILGTKDLVGKVKEMAHGTPLLVECKMCRSWGRMPRFGSGKCPCGSEITLVSKDREEELNSSSEHEWVGWFE